MLTPSAGRLRVAGLDPARQRIALARRIDVVFGQRGSERCGRWRSMIVAGTLDEDPKLSRARTAFQDAWDVLRIVLEDLAEWTDADRLPAGDRSPDRRCSARCR
ncbi:hypothetical protein BCD48_10415 [Pseudofrankia sp. BMG5.36]|nr:hypothetical protein BCD48_10415 [Pseudofrankia sp. BMG5.36]